MLTYFFRQLIVSLIPLIFLFTLIAVTDSMAFKGDTTIDEIEGQITSRTGDLDVMVKNKSIRILMPYNKTFFFFDGAKPRGLSYDSAMLFEKFINEKLKTKTVKIRVIVIPTSRDKLFSRLNEGYGDIAIGNLTITEERRELVDFSDPFLTNVSEIPVTNSKVPLMKNHFDLAGKEVHVRKSSSYYQSLKDLNELFISLDKPPIKIVAADDHLEDADLLEMINANLIPAIIIDNHKGLFWKQIFKNIRLHEKAEVDHGGRIGWAIRKNCPKLKAVVNQFAKKNKKGTLIGNVNFNRYLKNSKYIKNSIQGKEFKKFQQTIKIFKKYGKEYDFDYLMLAALGYQESQLNQHVKSHAGAIGVMQMLPSTAKDKNVSIPDIHKIDPNIHAGAKYLRFMANRYFPEGDEMDAMNSAFFTFAAYNAGPARIVRLRAEAKKKGLDPNLWFNNVELIAAKRIGRETVQYVSNILKYYVAYKLLEDRIN
ncbi:MAG: lytic transglycosylase F [Deltaproteobacteria bacterium]|nr:lytic transglycosylase F [Deltaproteobacteria bacterium]MBW2659653.1 lytic transglycosylase F [Deltaproteobacteria bacterium]